MSLEASARLYRILQMLECQRPTKVEIKERLNEEGYNCQDRTIERDLKVLRDQYGLTIRHDYVSHAMQWRNEYVLEKDDLYKGIRETLYLAWLGYYMHGIRKHGKSKLRALLFDAENVDGGRRYIAEVLDAIERCCEVVVRHKSFYSDAMAEKTIRPYALKQFRNRWYIFGELNGRENLVPLALDRVESLRATATVFTRRKGITPESIQEYFDLRIGVSQYEDESLDDVVLLFSEWQANYVRTLPFHESQKMVTTPEGVKVSLFLYPNYELEMEILKYGAEVEALGPKWLRERIQGYLQAALKRYEK